SPALTEALKQRFRRQMPHFAGDFWRRGRGRAVAADGTRIAAPTPPPTTPTWAAPAGTRPPPRSS
ncbi:MAG: hypothetical protein JOZ53_11425, partial [Planctomycetaceae bacterium]|nr:hypothetical protein [Planctomycetaceae bacterium]